LDIITERGGGVEVIAYKVPKQEPRNAFVHSVNHCYCCIKDCIFIAQLECVTCYEVLLSFGQAAPL